MRTREARPCCHLTESKQSVSAAAKRLERAQRLTVATCLIPDQLQTIHPANYFRPRPDEFQRVQIDQHNSGGGDPMIVTV